MKKSDTFYFDVEVDGSIRPEPSTIEGEEIKVVVDGISEIIDKIDKSKNFKAKAIKHGVGQL